ncbi:fibronectin type III domain-containing protein [Tellurirhabdus rosea]|uniref:fibronectin type III domain-containing protein n=1 Tax=Tellurirhabdus rosea TaxID=2674997 RepID=UPI00225B5181|nr:fibronectin type III domain-containing protein [Tellurirhabdus rosea]
MTAVKITTGFSTYRDKELDQKAQYVLASLTNNSNFPNPTPTLADLQTAVTDYQQALVKAAGGARQDTLEKNLKRESLIRMLDKLAAYVQFMGKDNVTALQSSGFDLSKPRRPVGPLPKPENFKVEPGPSEGTMLVSVDAVRNAKSYLIEYTSTPETPTSIWTPLVSSKSANLLTGLESGKQYVFRVAAIGSDPTRVYSDKISRFVA